MVNKVVFQTIIKKIIEEQQLIIGPLALDQANKIPGLKVSDGGNVKAMIDNDNPAEVLTALVKQYEVFFGQASVEVCKDVIKEIKLSVSPEDLPEILR